MKQVFFLFLIIAINLVSCKQKHHKESQKSMDLMKFGIPFSIDAPADAEATKIGSGNLTDISIKNKDSYDVQVFMSTAYTTDLKKLKQNKKDEIMSNPFFIKIIEEFNDGFLYEKKTTLDTKSYDFKIIKIVGQNEINFQCGNSKEFSEAEVKNMIRTIID